MQIQNLVLSRHLVLLKKNNGKVDCLERGINTELSIQLGDTIATIVPCCYDTASPVFFQNILQQMIVNNSKLRCFSSFQFQESFLLVGMFLL